MKATGIVRRMDDLGRVVIPKEIRRQMRIKEGDPLEIFTENGMVCFARYQPYNEELWKKADQIVQALLPNGCALLDRYQEVVFTLGLPNTDFADYKAQGFLVKEVWANGETACYVVAERGQAEMLERVDKVLRVLFAEEEE